MPRQKCLTERDAQRFADQLFRDIENDKLIVADKSEEQLSREIAEFAWVKYGVETHWHKKIVRTGTNTLCTYSDNPLNRVIQSNDILFIDFGFVVDGWECDFARTFVLGDDARKLKLKNDVEQAWYETQAWVHQHTTLKASDLFQYTREKARQYGWTPGGEIAGHIVGKFPHEQPADPKSPELDIHPDSHTDIFQPDATGNKRHWILEIHFTDPEKKIGGYFEQLL